jgi:hypothetical protein
MGFKVLVVNTGNARRQISGAVVSSEFFSPDNVEATSIREETAM